MTLPRTLTWMWALSVSRMRKLHSLFRLQTHLSIV